MIGRHEETWGGDIRGGWGGMTRQGGLLWREAGPPNHLDDKVDSDQ